MSARSEMSIGPAWTDVDLVGAAGVPADEVARRLGSSSTGLGAEEAASRLRMIGPNAVRSHGARPLTVLFRQLSSPLLLLLAAAAILSVFVGQHADAAIILSILLLSVGLGFVNEFRAERAIEELHERIHHQVTALRDDRPVRLDVTGLVPGDVVHLDVGDVVPADVRLLEGSRLECDEAVLTGESMPRTKTAEPAPGASGLDLPSCALMGSIVRAGAGWAVVVRTGGRTSFGSIALRLGERHAETAFQAGLRRFSLLLVRVTLVLTVAIFVINAVLHRPLLESALFSLAIAVGLTPQLLPAIVTVSLSTGARRLARRSVVVKRLVSIEDLGNIEILFTDKTGTLTEGRITFREAVRPDGADSGASLQEGIHSEATLVMGLVCNGAVVQDGVAVGGNPLDQALWEGASSTAKEDAARFHRIAEAPFDYDRRLMSVLADEPDGHRVLVTKGAPEAVLQRCASSPPPGDATLRRLFASGARVVAVATREMSGSTAVTPADERGLTLAGFLAFEDRPKDGVRASLEKLAGLGIEVKVVTGDNDLVASHLCAVIGLPVRATVTGAEIEGLSDERLGELVPNTTIFARVSPEQKSRIIRAQRARGTDVAFLGDGVNDAVALHDADVGISVDTATDVAKDAADIVLLRKDLGVLADGVMEGRRIFANTIKYVLMGTSSNFGNMFSAAGASLFLSFLPMLPTQILLNNLLYDVSELTIPTDEVDPELLERPSRWDAGFIRRFMTFFGPISSLYDFLTFAVMLWVFHATERQFHTGWFVESLLTQTLVIFAIRTRKVPFFQSRPSRALAVTTVACAVVAVILPFTPPGRWFRFSGLRAGFLAIVAVMVLTYLALVEVAKARFYRRLERRQPLAEPWSRRARRFHRVAVRWSLPRIRVLTPRPRRAG